VPAWTPQIRFTKKSTSIPWKYLLMLFLAGVGMLIMTYLRGVWGAIMAFLGILCIALACLSLLLTIGLQPWTALVLTVLLILGLEWFTYNRRITV
nr:hypothetical protein [Deltaproteobacteria bacterium]